MFTERSSRPGGYPNGRKNEYTTWKESQGLPAPGYRGSRPRPGTAAARRPTVAAALQQTTHEQPPRQFPTTATTREPHCDAKSILVTWCTVLGVPDDDDAGVCGLVGDGEPLGAGARACRPGQTILCKWLRRPARKCPFLKPYRSPTRKSKLRREWFDQTKRQGFILHVQQQGLPMWNGALAVASSTCHRWPQRKGGEWEIVAPLWRSRT